MFCAISRGGDGCERAFKAYKKYMVNLYLNISSILTDNNNAAQIVFTFMPPGTEVQSTVISLPHYSIKCCL